MNIIVGGKMKKLLFLFIVLFIANISPKAVQLPNYIDITADAVLLYSLDDDDYIYEKNADKEEILASLTKIMTAYTVIERVPNLNEKVTITHDHLKNLYYYTCAGLEEGDEVTYLDLLYAMMLPSGADAAQALAYSVGGTEENFIAMMNEEAQKLELYHTHFMDAYGGDDYNISTAREMALLLKKALSNELFNKIFKSDYYKLTNELEVYNYTGSIAKYHGLDESLITGSKMGYTTPAGLLLASTATINGKEYILIIMKSAENFKLTQSVLDSYSVYNSILDKTFNKRQLLKKGTLLKRIDVNNSTISEYPIIIDENIYATLSNEDYLAVSYDYHLVDSISWEQKVGDNLGYVDISINNEVIATYNIYLKDEIYQYTPRSRTIIIIIIILVFISLTMICFNIFTKDKKK